MRHFVYFCSCLVLLFCGVSTAAPKPAIVQTGGDWTVHVEYEHPQQILFEDPIDGTQKLFWYLIVTITNKTGRDVDFYPKCDLMTDTFKIVPADQNTPPEVFALIKTRHQSKYPFLEQLEKTDNKILQGSDNTKDIAVIFPDFDHKAKGVNFFIAGLSNETFVIDHPTAKNKNQMPKRVFLRKTLELDYSLGGDPAFRSRVKLKHKAKRWIMR